MPVVAVKRTQKLYFLLCHLYWHAGSFSNKFFLKKCPWRDLIRVDLIRFPGSIPGGREVCGLHELYSVQLVEVSTLSLK